MSTGIEAVTDEELSGVAGGYLVVSEWVSYLSTQIMPVIYGLSNGASANDRTILENVCGILRSAAIRGADAVAIVSNLWTTYNASYRSALQSSRIQATLDQALNNARKYIESHQ